jgi:hypothetical protein
MASLTGKNRGASIDRVTFDARQPNPEVRYRIGEAASGGMEAILQPANPV